MSKQNPEKPQDPDAVDTTVQPVTPPPAEQPYAATATPPTAPGEEPVGAAAPVADPAPRRGRLAWISSPKVAAATVITALALTGLGGAFALGRATAGPDHDRVHVRMVGFEEHGERGFGGPGMPGGPGFGG